MYVHAGLIIAVMVAVFVWPAGGTCQQNWPSSVCGCGGVVHTKACSVTSWKVCSPILISASSLYRNPVHQPAERAGGIPLWSGKWSGHFTGGVLCVWPYSPGSADPGALTGSGAVTVFTTGTLVGTVLTYMGIDKAQYRTIFLCAAMSLCRAHQPLGDDGDRGCEHALCWYATAIGSVSERAAQCLFSVGRVRQ